MEGCNCPDEIDPQRIGKGRVRRFRRWTQIFDRMDRMKNEANCRESSSLWLGGSVRTLPFPLCANNGVDKLLRAGPCSKMRVEEMWVMEREDYRTPRRSRDSLANFPRRTSGNIPNRWAEPAKQRRGMAARTSLDADRRLLPPLRALRGEALSITNTGGVALNHPLTSREASRFRSRIGQAQCGRAFGAKITGSPLSGRARKICKL